MIEKIDSPVSVTLAYDHTKRRVFPKIVVWDGKVYQIVKIGLHHTYRNGRTLFHVFSVISDTVFFKIVLNTDTLHWRLEEVADDESN